MTKIKGKSIRNPSPLDISVHKTERTAVAVLMHWMRQIIEKEGIDLGPPDVETSGSDRKMPDTVIYESRRSQNVLCLIEAKPPYFDVFDEKELKEPAREKAVRRKSKYFALTNFKTLVWYNTEKVNALQPEEEQIVNKYHLSEMENLDDLENAHVREPICFALREFLLKLYSVATGKEPEPRQALDDFLVFRLQEKIKTLSGYYRKIIYDQCHKDAVFAKKLTEWFVDQGWSFAWHPQDFDKAARQTAYLLVNKILFYNLLQAKRPNELDRLEIPASLSKGSLLKATLQNYFNEILKIDYETIYTADFIDTIAFPEAKEIVKEIKDLISVLQSYDFSKIGFDIIGRIFERLIPQGERHNLGQYFTSPDIVDLILRFCHLHENDKILDPACGAGTFLVRAYQHKKFMNQRKPHPELLQTLWGNDIAKFPAHLATINLAINDLNIDKNYPNILQEDFFALLVGDDGFELPERYRKRYAVGLGKQKVEITYPRWFDAIVGNPPYTRQEEIPDIGVDKDHLIQNALVFGKTKVANFTRRSGIHAYFFVHATKFLKENGLFGFIVSDSWLDADYGKGLQEFLLKHYKIIAIIGSKVERWFEQADINTCIIILQKCGNESQRDKNIVRFVNLKKPLRNFIPPVQDIWENQIKRLHAIDDLKKTILAHDILYENDDFRILPKEQNELWEDGYDKNRNIYNGSKWGKFLRAPAIFFKILKNAKDALVPLRKIADVRFGIKTGADPWFYVNDITEGVKKESFNKLLNAAKIKGRSENLRVVESGDGTHWLIEKEFLRPVLRNPDAYRKISIHNNEIGDTAVFTNEPPLSLRGSHIARYIVHGEKKSYRMGKGRDLVPAKTETCRIRPHWYILPDIKPARIFWQKASDVIYRHYFSQQPVLANQRFYPIYPQHEENSELIAALINSPWVWLYMEFQRSVMGLGAIEATVDEVKDILIFDPNKIKKPQQKKILEKFKPLSNRAVESVFLELGADVPENVTLDKIKKDRREFDEVLLGEVLGLKNDEQLDIYRAVIDLVRFRITKASSVKESGARSEGIDLIALKNTILQKIKKEP